MIRVPFLSSPLLLQWLTVAAGVLRQFGGLPMQMLEEFEALGAKARAQAQEMMDAEALLGDIPDEFLDPIQVLLFAQLLNCSIHSVLVFYFYHDWCSPH
jgi:hypothetical protein